MAISQSMKKEWAREASEAYYRGFMDCANDVEYSPFNANAYSAGYRDSLFIFHPFTDFRKKVVDAFPHMG